MNRRHCLALLAAAGGATGLAPRGANAALATAIGLSDPRQELWAAWKTRHMESSGRVVDRLQGGVSHSEGQSYGMVLATAFGDEETFLRLYDWTQANLAIRDDELLAWRWFPGRAAPVPDRNNASDGDIFHAWALIQAAERFGNGAYVQQAREIATALAETCIVPSPENDGTQLLLPATEGFEIEEGFVINPSYYMPRAMREIATATGQGRLASAAADGEKLMQRLAAGGVVPDWCAVTTFGLRAANGFSFDAGYEALRVPLFLIWSDLADHPAVIAYAKAASLEDTAVATVIARGSGNTLESSRDAGYRAIAALAECSGSNRLGASLPPFTADQPYFPATLQLFTMLAQDEVLPKCFPI